MAIQTTIKCGICLETAHEEEEDTWSVLLTCGHVFHSTCLELALQSQRPSVCPFCRDPPQLWKDALSKGKGITHKPIFLPLDCQAQCTSPEAHAPGAPTPGPNTPSTRPRISAEDFNSQVCKAEELRAELGEVRRELAEVSVNLEEAEEDLEAAQVALRKAEAAQEEQQQSFEDAKAALKEEVATKQRELQRLRQEKHDLKAQSEANMNSLRSQKVREEKAKLECQHRLAQQDLLLRKDLDAAGLSELYRRLSAASQECGKSADAAHADAMNMRNKQYQKLHGDYQKLSADFAAKRQLASSQAAQMLQLQGEVSRLTKRLQAQTEQQSETPLRRHGSSMPKQARGSGIPYDTPPDELMLVRLACSPSPAMPALQKKVGQSANAPPRVIAGGGTQQEGMVALNGTEAADDIAASAAAFAQQLLAGKARAHVQHSRSSQHGSHGHASGAGRDPSSPSRHILCQGLQREAHMRSSTEDSGESQKLGSQTYDDVAAYVMGDSDDDLELELELLDRKEEQELLSKFEDTAVDMEALPAVSSLLSPQQGTQSAQGDANRGKENVALRTSSADLSHSGAGYPGCAKQEALLARHGKQGGCPGRPGGFQHARKQLRRICDPSSSQEQQLLNKAGAAGDDMSDDDAQLLASDFADARQSREAGREAGRQHTQDAERPASLEYSSDDDVSLAEETTRSRQAVRCSMPPQANSQGASAAVDRPTQTGWRSLGSVRLDQDSTESWECSLPRSSGPSGQLGSASPGTSQHRCCGQGALPPSSRYASDAGRTGLTAGTGSFVGGRLPNAGGGTYVRRGPDGRGGNVKLLAPDMRPKLKRQAPLSFGGRTSAKLAAGNKRGKSNAAHGTLPVTAYFR